MSKPMILDCDKNWTIEHASGHRPDCWRKATPAERLAGLKPEDGDLSRASNVLRQNIDSKGPKVGFGKLTEIAVAAWLGET